MTNLLEDKYLPIGKIVNVFGINGWIKIKFYNHSDEILNKYNNVFISDNNNKIYGTFKLIIEEFFIQKNIFHIKLKNINNRNDALKLKGYGINILKTDLPKIDTGEYYWIDLIGIDVYNNTQHHFGKITSLIEVGDKSVMIIDNHKQPTVQTLIPFIDIYVMNVDLVQKKIMVDWGIDY